MSNPPDDPTVIHLSRRQVAIVWQLVAARLAGTPGLGWQTEATYKNLFVEAAVALKGIEGALVVQGEGVRARSYLVTARRDFLDEETGE